jgi:molybdopterin converting factor small subunit
VRVVPVVVQLPTILRPFAGGEPKVEALGATVSEVFSDLEARFPGIGEQLITEDGGLHRFVNVYLDDEDIRYLDALSTPVRDGAVIAILPAVAGGARAASIAGRLPIPSPQ